MKELCDSILNVGGEVITFGCSMAGYGALLFGSILKVDKILALSPTCPKYTQRNAVLNELSIHIERYEELRNVLTASECKKILIYGGVAPQDYASALEFDVLLNSKSTLVNGASHQIIEPLLHKYGLKEILDFSDVRFNSTSINLSDLECIDYYKAAVNYRYCESDVTAHDLLSVARDNIEKIVLDDFCCVFYADLLLKNFRDHPLIKRLVLDGLRLSRPVSLLSLRLLKNSLSQHDEEFVYKYCSRGVEFARNKNLTSSEDCMKMIALISEIIRSLSNTSLTAEFLKVHSIENNGLVNERVVIVNQTGKFNSKDVFSKVMLESNMEIADVLREIAFAFKEVGDLTTACVLLEKALEQRPSGPVIRKALERYRKEFDVI